MFTESVLDFSKKTSLAQNYVVKLLKCTSTKYTSQAVKKSSQSQVEEPHQIKTTIRSTTDRLPIAKFDTATDRWPSPCDRHVFFFCNELYSE